MEGGSVQCHPETVLDTRPTGAYDTKGIANPAHKPSERHRKAAGARSGEGGGGAGLEVVDVLPGGFDGLCGVVCCSGDGDGVVERFTGVTAGQVRGQVDQRRRAGGVDGFFLSRCHGINGTVLSQQGKAGSGGGGN